MKIVSPLFLRKVSSTEISQLIKETKETLDIQIISENRKKFTKADLWNIHNQKRSFSSRRFI